MEILLGFLVVPVIMIIAGAIMLYKAPKKMNPFFGYRTSMSMKSQETWQFAHALCGKLWVIIGCVLLVISVLPLICAFKQDASTIEFAGTAVTYAQVAVMLCSVVYVEIMLRRNFDKNGDRKCDWEI